LAGEFDIGQNLGAECQKAPSFGPRSGQVRLLDENLLLQYLEIHVGHPDVSLDVPNQVMSKTATSHQKVHQSKRKYVSRKRRLDENDVPRLVQAVEALVSKRSLCEKI
jgi:hypothetical protein